MKTLGLAGWMTIVASMIGCSPSTAGFTSGTDGSSSGSDEEPPTDTNETPSDDQTSAGSASASGGAETTGGSAAGTSTGTPTGPETTDATTTGGETDACNQAHAEPGCSDSEVEMCVCDQLPNCCVFEWEGTCAELAEDECGATGEDTGSTGGTSTTTGEPTAACDEVVTFEMLPSEATLSGAWELGMSMVGEGEIAVLNQMLGTGGSILFEPEIPCDDTWTIWVRYWEQGSDDSYFATLDGTPMPDAIFEGDCSGAGNGYAWTPLNWRDQNFGPCEYVEDPWAPVWDAGTHAIEFSFRESLAMGRILITNDPALVP